MTGAEPPATMVRDSSVGFQLLSPFPAVSALLLFRFLVKERFYLVKERFYAVSSRFRTRNVSGTGEDQRKFCWNEEELKIATGNEKVTCLQHSLRLHSAYRGVPGNFSTRDNVGEPLATSYHSRFFGTVDYIWHSEQLVPLRVLETLSRNTLENMGGLPSKDWGSDHLALACEFAFANSDSNTRSKKSPTTGYDS